MCVVYFYEELVFDIFVLVLLLVGSGLGWIGRLLKFELLCIFVVCLEVVLLLIVIGVCVVGDFDLLVLWVVVCGGVGDLLFVIVVVVDV